MNTSAGGGTAADAVFSELVAEIISGDLLPGSPLPSESDLSESKQVSRSILREALSRLVHAGLITTKKGGKTRVTNWSQTAGLDILPYILTDRNGPIPDIILSTFDLRELIYADGARLCAQRGSAAVHSEISAIAEQHATHKRPTRALHVPFSPFWNAILRGSASLTYRLTLNSMNSAAAFATKESPLLDARIDPAPHVALARAIAVRDTVLASALGREIAQEARESWVFSRRVPEDYSI